jgi:hypothetical protein
MVALGLVMGIVAFATGCTTMKTPLKTVSHVDLPR